MMRIGSLFSGGGGGDHGLQTAGHQMIFGCEIDKHSRAVLRYNNRGLPVYLNVKDITRERLEADGIEPPDLIVGGSPCQDLSVAGRRAGLGGERSGLFYEQCRIADELGCGWVIWENVVGALSSNKGADFATALGELTGFPPTVPDGGWKTGGVCVGPKRVAVWRVLDAQSFGVPQRRRRIFVIAGPRTMARRVAEVLLESEGSSRSLEASKETRDDFGSSLDDRSFTSSTGALTSVAQCLTTKNRVDLVTQSFVLDTPRFGEGHEATFDDFGLLQVVRTPTPLECDRLMGWPDDFTRYGLDDDNQLIEIAKTHRYRICGNGMVAPVMEWIGRRLP